MKSVLTSVPAITGAQTSSPSAGDTPAVPATSPLDWVLAAVARRDLAGSDISYNPTVILDNGVISGFNTPVTPNGLPLTYTVVSAPSQGGKVNLDTNGNFTFLPYATVVTSRGSEQFSVLVAETTAFNAALEQLPVVGSFVPSILVQLHQVPIVNTLLSPLIGQSEVVVVKVNVDEVVPVDAPVAYTLKVISFDGTPISVNYFPASGLMAGQQAPTVLNGPGLATRGNTDPNSETIVAGLVPGLKPLRDAGYNVVTWDPRGEFDSGGVLQLDSPFYEGRDVSAIIDWVSAQPQTLKNGNDPLIGMVGGSYGGGIQLVTAAIDSRVDAIVPAITWNSQLTSLYPNDAFKTVFSSLLLLSLVESDARINPQMYEGILTGVLTGFLTNSQQAFLAGHGPSILVNNITAPTLVIQGTVDVLFPLEEANTNVGMLSANGVPVQMIWACGGHGACLDPVNPNQTTFLVDVTLDWLDRYVKGESVDTGQTFRWVDQTGQYYASDFLPTDEGFYADPLVTTATGGFLPIVPLLGGSGPENGADAPLSWALAAPANIAIDVPLQAPDEPTYVVGSPELTMTYSGLGTTRHVYAQVVDKKTGLVLGNILTPIPVTLDGGTHTVTVPLEDIAYTMDPDSELTLQIVGSSTAYLNLTSVGYMNVSNIQVKVPTAANAVPISLPSSTPELPISTLAAAA